MAALPTADRNNIWGKFMSDVSAKGGGLGGGTLLKLDLRAAVYAIDDWIEANQASFNSSLPQPARSALTAKQKVELFMAVAKRRFEVT